MRVWETRILQFWLQIRFLGDHYAAGQRSADRGWACSGW